MVQRCVWCGHDPLYQAYHDQEWGKPNTDEAHLFEMLCLEGQQAGLAWITILRKREAYRQHFFQYPIEQIAAFTDAELQEKCQDTGLIRHIGKLTAIRDNAKAWCRLKQQGIHVSEWLWQIVDHQPILNVVDDEHPIPASTALSQQLSQQLKKQGFKFVGPTTCYAFMQACGMVNDHHIDCDFRLTTIHPDQDKGLRLNRLG